MQILRKEDWFHADGFPIAVERRDPQEPFGLHRHEFWEIVIITGGKGLHVTGEDSWALTVGDAFVIGGSRPHDYVDMDRLRLINVLFEPGVIGMTLKDLPSLPGYHALFHLEPAWRQRHQFRSRLQLTPNALTAAIDLVGKLEAELSRRDPGFGFVATAVFMQFVAHLSRCYGQNQDEGSKTLLRLAQTITHIETRYAEPIQLHDLVAMSQMSRRSYLRAFRGAMNCTPIAYLLQVRVTRAAELLRKSELTVTDVAFEVGFTDSNYFSRQFRAALGVTPSKYRKTSDG